MPREQVAWQRDSKALVAIRPVFVPVLNTPHGGVRDVPISFEWFPGFAVSQKRKSIAALHAAAKGELGVDCLEISRRSDDDLGCRLSAWLLEVPHPTSGRPVSVEAAFQASKVFERSGPFHDLYGEPPGLVRKAVKEAAAGRLVGFDFAGVERWPLQPFTAFYDRLYLQGLGLLSESDQNRLASFGGFTDIEFNPRGANASINCQARTCALFASWKAAGVLARIHLSDMRDVLEHHGEAEFRYWGIA